MKIARVALVAKACGLMMLSAGATYVAASPSAPAPATVSSPTAAESAVFSVATYNTHAKLPVNVAVSDVVGLAEAGVDVITLQEMAGRARRKEVREALVDCSMCAYEAYMPEPAVPGGTPILYRWDRFRFEGSGTRQVSEDTYVGPKGAGPSTLRAKYVNYVQLRERASGRSVVVLNNHAVPSVQGKGGKPNRKMSARLGLYRKHMVGLQQMVAEFREAGALVFVTGDLNVNFRRDRVVQPKLFPYKRLGAVGLKASFDSLGEPKRGTHVLKKRTSTRLIDYVYYSPDAGLEPLSQRVLTQFSSDHRPLVVDFEVSPGT